MKKILLATTMIVGGASIAAAEVTLSGDARMGICKNFEDGATPYQESDVVFTSRARVKFTLSGETDGGLSFGGSFRAHNAEDAAAGQSGDVFISGAFGKLSMGDVDGAAQMATGHVDGVGLTGIGDLNESTFLAAGGGDVTADPTALYEYSAGAFTVYVSVTNPDALVDIGPAAPPAPNNFVAEGQAFAIGAKYTFGDYAVGLGYEKLKGYTQPAGPFNPAAADTIDLDHIVLSGSATISGITVKALIGQADGINDGAVLNNEKQYAASASYTTGALTGVVFYSDDSNLGGDTGFGLGGSYDLGGGAKVVGGFARNVNGADTNAADIGVSFEF
jgi:outer membrane protein OmpU